MAYVRSGNSGGGGGGSAVRLCRVEYVGLDTIQIPVVDTLTQDSDFSTYLSYDSSTKKFTVLQDFDAVIVPWVQNYRGGASRQSQGEFYINNQKKASYTAANTQLGTTAGIQLSYPFKANDTFWNYTPSGNGYPQQMLKVYLATGPSGWLDFV